MDAICLNPIIRPQFITATLFSYRCDTVCFNNSSSMLLLSASTATGNVEWVGGILRHFTSLHPCNDREIFSYAEILILSFIRDFSTLRGEQEKYFH